MAGKPPVANDSTSEEGGETDQKPEKKQSAVKSQSKRSGSSLETERGTTTIASTVVAKIAGLAAQEIPGVQAMGSTMSRAYGSLLNKVPGASQAESQGVTVEVGDTQAAVDIDIVVYYGNSIVEVAEAIRQNVIDRIEGMTGLEVVEVNVEVHDLYLGDSDEDQGSRVA